MREATSLILKLNYLHIIMIDDCGICLALQLKVSYHRCGCEGACSSLLALFDLNIGPPVISCQVLSNIYIRSYTIVC